MFGGFPAEHRASLVAQLVKKLPATREALVRFLGRKGPLEKGRATHSSILGWRIQPSPWGRKELDRLRDFHFHFSLK